jgi:hypothetical protein
MSTLINKAITAIVDALNSAPAVCRHIDRVRLRPVAQSVALAIAVRPVQSEVQQFLLASMPVSWLTTVSVECYARSGASTPADVAVDVLLESVYSRLMADPTLAGVVVALQPKGISYDFDADGEQSTCASIVFNVMHRSAGANLS